MSPSSPMTFLMLKVSTEAPSTSWHRTSRCVRTARLTKLAQEDRALTGKALSSALMMGVRSVPAAQHDACQHGHRRQRHCRSKTASADEHVDEESMAACTASEKLAHSCAC
eukprot:1473155-Rhodomonas_salina.2